MVLTGCDNDDHIRVILKLLAEARLLKVRLWVLITSRPKVPIRYSFCQILNIEYRDFIVLAVEAYWFSDAGAAYRLLYHHGVPQAYRVIKRGFSLMDSRGCHWICNKCYKYINHY